jgi:hypothetical protein
MNGLIDSITEYLTRSGNQRFLPEHREIKLYSNSAGVRFMGDDKGVSRNLPIPGLLNTGVAFMLLDTFFESRDSSLEGKTCWEKYQALPRSSRIDKMVAQVYRMLRVFRMALVREGGSIEESRGAVKIGCIENATVFSLIITRSGLTLLESFVVCYLNSFRQPYGEAYAEALLSQYYADITNEIKKFQDEDADILRFRKQCEFNRHFRLDCGNPKYAIVGDHLVFEIIDSFYDPLRYPIDFFVMVDEELHVIPIEALTHKKLPIQELPVWKARTLDGKNASSQLHLEFGFETLSNGGPMS